MGHQPHPLPQCVRRGEPAGNDDSDSPDKKPANPSCRSTYPPANDVTRSHGPDRQLTAGSRRRADAGRHGDQSASRGLDEAPVLTR